MRRIGELSGHRNSSNTLKTRVLRTRSSANWLCLLETCRYLSMCCPHNTEKGNEHEQICKSIACYMALSIPLGLGAKVSVSGAARADRQGGAEMRNCILSAV